MKYRLLVIANIGFIIGIIVGLYFSKSIILFLSIFVCISALLLNLIHKLEKFHNGKLENNHLKIINNICRYLKVYITRKVIITFIISFMIGLLLLIFKESIYETFWKDMDFIKNNDIKVYAIIVSNKEEKEYNDVYKIKLINVNNKKYYNTYCILKLNKAERDTLSYGDLIYFTGEFQEPQERTNYKGYSYKEYLKTINVYGTFKSKYNKIKILKEDSYSTIYMLINKVRNSFEGQIDKLYSNISNNKEDVEDNNAIIQAKALLKGILLGEKTDLTEKQVENFKISNLSHILAVSGMHITYIITGIIFILRIFGISKQKIHILTILGIIFFTYLTEFTPSVVRASIMAILVLLAFLVKRKSDVWINISISSLIILLYNPYTLFSLSYQLSFLGTIGIILGMKVWKVRQGDTQVVSNKNQGTKEVISYIKRFYIDTVIVCISAQLFVFPIILLNFNIFSPYFLIANLLIAPIIGIVIILGFFIILVSYIFYPIAKYLNFIEIILLKFMNIMTNFISNLPNSSIYLKTPYVISVVIYFVIILIFIGVYTSKKRVIKRKIKKYSNLLMKIFKIFLVIYLIIILAIDLNIFSGNNIKIYFVDVGQGDCTLIVTDKNKKILVDGGGSNDKNYDVGKSTTLPYLLDRRITNLDYVLISHFDSDHVQGLYAVLENIKVKNIIVSKQKENSENYKKFLKIVGEKNIKVEVVNAGDRIVLDKDLYIDILWPTENLEISDNPLNNNSIVAKLVYKKFSILFTGDIEEKAENAILKRYDGNLSILQATILKVAHHGSKTSSSEQFLEAVKPKIALIGVGRTNTFGHPAEITLERLRKLGTKIYRTDEEGEIVIKSNGKGYYGR